MIVDSSVWVAVLMGEEEAEGLAYMLESYPVSVSAASLVESSIVLRGRGRDAKVAALDQLLRDTDAVIVPVDERQARIAVEAYRRYGRGSGNPAKLNYGDCFSYAAAIALDEPLLFKGNDFMHTDVRRAGADD